MSFNSVYFRPSLRPGVCWLVWVSARRCKIEQRTNFPEVGVCVCPWPVPCLSSRHSWCSTNLRITWTWTLSSGWTTTCKTGKRRCSSSLTTSLSSITFAQTSFISIRYTYIWPCFVFWVLWYRAFHWYGLTKFAYGGLVLGSSQLSLLPRLTLKLTLTLKVSKKTQEVIISLISQNLWHTL